MKLEQLAAVSNILALVPGAYCAYGTWVLLHSSQASAQGQAPSPSLSGVLYSLLTAIGLIVLAAVLNLLASRRPKFPQQGQSSPVQLVASAAARPTPPSPIDVDAFFLHSYSGQLQAETEKNVRAMVEGRPPDERVEFAIKFIATGIVSVVYDKIWMTVFRSQLLALLELNKRILRREEVKQYYDAASQEFPAEYATYKFDQWLTYMRGQLLILEHPGDTVEITVRGKDFLKYMLHCGYTLDQRRL